MIAALALAAACFNELHLFCDGKRGDALVDCLTQYEDDATKKCRDALGQRPAPQKSAKVWSSAASAKGSLVSSAVDVEAAVADREAPKGFELAVEEEPSYYPVSGKTRAEILASMGGSGLTDGIDGSRGAATTGASVTGRYSRVKTDKGCAMTAAKVTVTVKQRLPQWDAPADAAPDAKAWWDKLSSVIRLHEDGHKAIDVDMGRATLAYLQQLGSLPTCSDLDDVVASEVHRANIEGMEKNVAYDQQTRHGQTQYDAAFGIKR